MTKSINIFLAPIVLIFSSLLVTSTYAQNNVLGSTQSSVEAFGDIVNTTVGIVVTLAFLFFFWNLATYILREEDKEVAKKKMGWSLLAMIVITSLWGLISFARSLVGIGNEGPNEIQLPTVNVPTR